MSLLGIKKFNEEVPSEGITLTAQAVGRVKSLLEEEGKGNLGLRLYVEGGGCHGFQYGMNFDEKPGDGDEVIETDGIVIFIDPMSLNYLKGSVVDYTDNMIGGGFDIKNPNAASSCGCGHSFRVEDAEEVEESKETVEEISASAGGSCH